MGQPRGKNYYSPVLLGTLKEVNYLLSVFFYPSSGYFPFPSVQFILFKRHLNRGQCETISGKPYSLSYLTDQF